MKKPLGMVAAVILVPFMAVLLIAALVPAPKVAAACVNMKDTPGADPCHRSLG